MRRFYHPWSFISLLCLVSNRAIRTSVLVLHLQSALPSHFLSTRRIAFIIDIIYIEFETTHSNRDLYIQPGEPVLFL